MNKNGKVWGTTSKIFEKNNVSIHRIEIIKNGFCSRHKHKYKYNTFYVESGIIKIQIFRSNNIIDETILKSGDRSDIPPDVEHKFIGLENSIVYEIYYVELIDEDIERVDCGGIL